MKISVLDIAQVAHDVIRAHCGVAGVPNYPAWEDTPSEIRERTIAGVQEQFDNPTPEQQHEAWVIKMENDGWTHGAAFDLILKTHPGLVPFAERPQVDVIKQALFRSIVQSLR
ncbi:MAG: RyR domain-containing protein [Gemmatimonadaceae bacterium]